MCGRLVCLRIVLAGELTTLAVAGFQTETSVCSLQGMVAFSDRGRFTMKPSKRLYRCTCRLTMDVVPETLRIEHGAVLGEAKDGGVTFSDRRPEVIRKVQLLINLPQFEKGAEFAKLRSTVRQSLQQFYDGGVVSIEVFAGALAGQVELVINPEPYHGKVQPHCRVITLLLEPMAGWKLSRPDLTKPSRSGKGFV